MIVKVHKLKFSHEVGIRTQTLSLPYASEILCFKVGKKSPYILVLEDGIEKTTEDRIFLIAQTDQEFLNILNKHSEPEKFEIEEYIGTDLDSAGMANHLFEVKKLEDWEK